MTRFHPLLRTLLSNTLMVGFLALPAARAQQGAVVSGVITDPSNALVPNATVVFHETEPRGIADRTLSTTRNGLYRFVDTPGTRFEIFVTAPGFATFDSGPMRFRGDEPMTLNIRLKIQDPNEQITVNEDSASSDPSRNGDAIVLKGRAIDDLPLDSTELQQELQALAGSPTPDIYVDGFSGGTLPPRDTIREIRINQNPYSAQNDTNPSNGQIYITTKPGSNKLHGDFYAYANDSAFNTLNPFVASQPPYYNAFLNGSLNGPLTKHSSFFVSYNQQQSDTNSIINAQILDPTNTSQINFTQAVATPSTGYYFSGRADFAPSEKSTLTARYSNSQGTQINGGVGGLNLLSQAYNNDNRAQIFQLSNSQIFSPHIVNDTRFQYTRSRVSQTPSSTAPTINVEGAFVNGGSSAGAYNDNQDRYELQNYVSANAGKQFFTFGLRFRDTRDANHSSANYNGTFTFASLASYQATLQGVAGAGPSQFTITTGDKNVAVNVADTALFFQDDWKARANLTLSGGLRFETQNVIANKADYAPRFGFAYGLGQKKDKPAQYTLRGGAGLFYTRFTSGYVLQAARQNGITQQEYIASANLTYPAIPSPSALAASPSAIYQISPTFHAPYFFSSTVSIERQIRTWGSVTLSYLGNRGVHIQLTRNINAPLPGTYNPAVPTSGVRPLGGNQNIYEYDSVGLWRQNRLTSNFFLHFKNNRFIVYGYYQLRHDTTDASGGGFPSNQYDIGVDQGRSTGDSRHSAYVGTGMQLPFNFHTYIFARAQSGNPFNITVGQDLNGDSIFNDRPAFATDLTRPSVVKTQFGNFDTSPIAGQTIIPIDYGNGPGLFLVNVQFSRVFDFGPEIKAAAGATPPKLAPGEKPHINRRFSLEIGADAQNLFNQVNLAAPIGTLNSPLFGHSIALANTGSNSSANRLIKLEAYFHF